MPMGQYLAHATGMYGFGWIFEILILVVFFGIVYWIVKSSQKNESALDILNKRYAKGELTKHEYIELKKDLALGDK